MSTSSLSRRIMVVMIAAIVALGGIALPAAAKGGHKGRGDHQTETVNTRGKGRSAEKRALQRAPKFVVVGFVTSVDTPEIEVRIKGGNKSLRKLGTPVTFTVADGARVKLNGERVDLSELAAGDRVVVKGAKIGDVLTAFKVFASREEDDEDDEDSTESDDTQETENTSTGDASSGDDASGTGDATTGDDTSTSDGEAVTP